MSNELASFACDQCGRDAVDIARCRDRRSGNCAFVRYLRIDTREPPTTGGRKRSKNEAPVLLIMFGVVMLALYFITLAGLQFLAILSLIGIGVAIWVLSSRIVYYNFTSRVFLEVNTFAGIRRRHKWTPPGRVLPISLESGGSFDYPPSVAMLAALCIRFPATRQQAVSVFRAALVGLLARGSIQVLHFQSYVFKGAIDHPTTTDDYVLVATSHRTENEVPGVLEDRIMWQLGLFQNTVNRGDTLGRNGGRTLCELVYDIYERDRPDPNTWLAALVADDAVSRGLVKRSKHWLSTTLDWDTANSQFFQHQQLAQALSQQLFQAFPNFALALDDQIWKGITSRVETSGD